MFLRPLPESPIVSLWGKVIRERTELLRRILPLMGYQSYSSLRVLDIGAGTADLLSAARSLGIGSVVAMDLSPLNCTYINRLGIPVVQADAENIPFRARSFDIVTLCQVIEHIEYPQRMLEQIFSLLRPGSILHIDTLTPGQYLRQGYQIPDGVKFRSRTRDAFCQGFIGAPFGVSRI